MMVRIGAGQEEREEMTGQGIVTNQPRVAIWKSGLGRRGESESECVECVGHEQQRHERHEATNEKDEAAKLLLLFLLFTRPRSFEYQAREID